MSKNTILIAAVVAMLGVAGFVYYSVTKSAPKKVTEQPKAVLDQINNPQSGNESGQSPPSSSPSGGNSGSGSSGSGAKVDPAAAKGVVTKFVLAVANPANPTADKQKGLAFVADSLKSKDPGKLLAVSQTTGFTVGDPFEEGGKTKVAVNFNVKPPAQPVQQIFSFQQSGSNVVISQIDKK